MPEAVTARERPVIGAYPGSFNPPTLAHLAVAEAAVRQFGLRQLDLVVSMVALGKEDLARPLLRHRLSVLEDVAASRPWLRVEVTTSQLICDVAAGYDLVVVGADKWAQVLDPAWYGGSEARRDAAVARLPLVAVAPRPPHPIASGAAILDVDPALATVSSTAVRQGAARWMAEEAARFASTTGAWVDPDRYESWLRRTARGDPAE